MKIAFLGTRGIPATYGGFETCVQELSVRLANRGHEVEVYCRTDWPTHAKETFGPVRLVNLPRLRRGVLQTPFNAFISTVRACLSDADIVHYFGGGTVPFAILGRAVGKKVILTVDGIEWNRTSYSRLARFYLRALGELSMIMPNVTVADSRSSQDWYHGRTGILPEYIPYGTAISSDIDSPALEKYGLDKRGYIMFAGRLVSEKGTHTLVEAFKSVPSRLELVVVGDFPGGSPYVENLKRSADDRTRFLGYVYGKDFATLRNACQIYVHPSLLEGTSISLLGALGSGCCIVSSDLRENLEVAGDAAVYFRRGNSEDLSNVLNELLRDEERVEAMRSKASKRAKELFDWEGIAGQYEDIYLRLMGFPGKG